MIETTVCTFDISIPFAEWSEKFDHDEAPARDKNGVKVIFRGVSQNNPLKVIVVVQAIEGVLEKHIGENFDFFQENGAVMTTALPTVWSSY